MKLINIVLASLLESTMAYSYYKVGAPADIYWFRDQPMDKNAPICNCEVFCSTDANCAYFVTSPTTCYLYNSAPLAGWQNDAKWNTYSVGNSGNSDCFNGVFNIEI